MEYSFHEVLPNPSREQSRHTNTFRLHNAPNRLHNHLGIFSFALLRKPIHITRLTLGTTFLFIAFEIVMPPLCISRQGNILLSPGNMSCLAGNDTFVSWLWSLVGVPYGTPLMFYLTYIFGMVFFFFLAVLFLKERELWRTIAKV